MPGLATTKLFDRKQCRTCGGKITVTRVCLECQEPTEIWCENCFKIEDYGHYGHQELELF